MIGSLPSSNAIRHRILSRPWAKEAFIADAWDVVGRKVSKERLLADIYQTAKSSVGLPVAPDSDAARMFRLVLGEGRSLIAQRNEIEDRAVELLKDQPRLSAADIHPGDRPDQCADHPGRGWRSAPLSGITASS